MNTNDYTFQPILNKKSMKLASNRDEIKNDEKRQKKIEQLIMIK